MIVIMFNLYSFIFLDLTAKHLLTNADILFIKLTEDLKLLKRKMKRNSIFSFSSLH